MKHLLKLLLVLLLMLGLTLTACGNEDPTPMPEPTQEMDPEPTDVPAPEPTDEPAPEPTEEPAPEPTEEPVLEVVPADDAAINAAFQTNLLDTMTAYNTISLEDTNLALVEDAPPFLLDVREMSELEEKGHIEGAVNIPLRELAQNTQYLPSTDTPIITYCGSGWRANIAMSALAALGYEDVRVMTGGSYGGWVDAGYATVEGAALEPMELNVAELDPAMVMSMDAMLQAIPEGWGGISADDLNIALAETPDMVLIDVRRSEEVAEKGNIDAPEVVFAPIEAFAANSDMWPADKDAPITVYCGSGHRSTMAASILWANGYTNVKSLKGGYGAWNDAGYATVGGTAVVESSPLDEPFQNMLDTMTGYNTISLEDVNLALIEDPPPFLLDVREVAELEEKGHIDSAINIPLRELGKNTQYLPSLDTPIITYCGSGWRATSAMVALKALGYEDVKVMTGGSYGGWLEAGYATVDGVAAEPFELNAVEFDPDVLASVDVSLETIPEGWGVITAETLNTELIENPDLIVIDVRRDEEVAEKGYIEAETQSFIPIEELVAMKELWPSDKQADIVVYCGSGHRSTMAMAMLRAYGYENVRSLKGGFGGWAEAGYPVMMMEASEAHMGDVDLDTAFQNMLDTMEGYNTISLEDTNLALIEDPPPFLLDVRSISEAEEKGHIDSAIMIPLRELGQNTQYLPAKDVPIITYCGSGWRATMAMVALKAMGYEDVKVMTGGSYGGWVEAGYATVEGVPADPIEINPDLDPAMVAAMDAWLSEIPEGWGSIAADDLNLALVENPDLILIDVRRDEEVAEKGVIEGENLIHIPLESFILEQDMWPMLDDSIVAYCGSGHRSTMAMSMLWAYMYNDVLSLKGGFGAWSEAGYPVVEYAVP